MGNLPLGKKESERENGGGAAHGLGGVQSPGQASEEYRQFSVDVGFLDSLLDKLRKKFTYRESALICRNVKIMILCTV
jgi:hypothetical protein